MAGPRDRTDEAALWRGWRSASASVDAAGAEADALAARRAAHTETLAASPAVVARAAALVAEGDAQVLPFRRPRPVGRMASWRAAALWSGMAASLLVTSLIGFTLGNSAYLTLAGGASPAFGQELFDPP